MLRIDGQRHTVVHRRRKANTDESDNVRWGRVVIDEGGVVFDGFLGVERLGVTDTFFGVWSKRSQYIYPGHDGVG